MIDLLGAIRRMMNKQNVPETFDPSTDSLEALGDASVAILAAVGAIQIPPPTPLPSMYEGWMGGMDPTVWTFTDPVSGAVWAFADNSGVLTVSALPDPSNSARLESAIRWPSSIGSSTNKILRALNVEWEMQIGNFANVDEPTFLAGLSTGLTEDKTTPNVIGFGISAGVLTAYSSNGGNAEETFLAVGAPNTFQKFRLKCYGGAGGDAKVEYYVNEVLVATHDGTGAPFAVPSGLFYQQLYFPAGAGGTITPIVGGVRIWTEDT